MSFAAYSTNIKLGDIVVVYKNPENMSAEKMVAGGTYHNSMGKFLHADMVGKPWGSKVYSSNKKGFVHLLYPTPELWTTCLPHRTQILYMPDIAYVSCLLDLRPGVKMIESGTGSGSFSHAIARTLAPSGHLYTFEYHEQRANKVKEEFESHGLSDIITVEQRDVCKDGFGIEDLVTAVFLDLPAPWDAIPAAKNAFKRDRVGRICCFSPCIEQVHDTVKSLKENEFTDIRMFEVLIKNQYVQAFSLPQIPTEFKRTGRPKRKQEEDSAETVSGEADDVMAEANDDETNGTDPTGSKRTRVEGAEAGGEEVVSAPVGAGTSTNGKGAQPVLDAKSGGKVLMARVQNKTRGHTSYLTFATLLPR